MRFNMRDSPLVGNIDDTALMQLVAAARSRSVRTGANIVTRGTEGNSMFLLKRGLALVQIDGVTKRTIHPGQCFGEVALAMARLLKNRDTLRLFGDVECGELAVRTADVVSAADSELLEWTVDSIAHLLDAVPRLSYNLQRLALARLHEAAGNGRHAREPPSLRDVDAL